MHVYANYYKKNFTFFSSQSIKMTKKIKKVTSTITKTKKYLI